jgi:phosphohistidine swiveling domain-containing protein
VSQVETREAVARGEPVPGFGPIAAPPGFPVVWEQPDDEQRFWEQDRMHFPDPITLLDDAMMRIVYVHGFNRAAEYYGLPIRGHARRIGAYHYSSMAPNVPPEQMEAQGRIAEERINPAVAGLGELWERAWLPEIQQHIAALRAFDLERASIPELVAHLGDTEQRIARLWEIHFLLAFPMLLALSLFDDFYRDLFGDEDAFQAYRLLQGFENKTLESNQAMWALSRRAVADPTVRQVFGTLAVGEIVPALQESGPGRAFLAELRTFLEEYGRRGDTWGLRPPGWIEAPTSVIRNLKDYVAQPDRDLAAERAALIEERERLLAETRERLAGYPRPVVGQFEELLKSAQFANILSEEHGFWIDFTSTYEVRLVFLELGKRFAAAGVLDGPDGIFFLTINETRETAEALPTLDRRALVAERQAELEQAAAITPPPVLGTPPSGPPPQDPIGRAIMKMFGGGPPPISDVPTELRGSAGSPGKVSGTARVIRSLDEADRLRPGDVLVAEFTAPPWTPLFATVSAVVTDAGGILSHCAVVAREYGIPAVVGTARATATIRDGQQVEVDGNAGLVRLLD